MDVKKAKKIMFAAKAIFVLSLAGLFGIVGGVELGAPLWNLLWCIPCVATAWVSAEFAGFID